MEKHQIEFQEANSRLVSANSPQANETYRATAALPLAGGPPATKAGAGTYMLINYHATYYDEENVRKHIVRQEVLWRYKAGELKKHVWEEMFKKAKAIAFGDVVSRTNYEIADSHEYGMTLTGRIVGKRTYR